MELNLIQIENLSMSPEQIRVMGPYLWMFGGATLALLASTLKRWSPKWLVVGLSLLTLLMAMLCSYPLTQMATGDEVKLFSGMMESDAFSNFFNLIFLATAFLTILVSVRYLDREGLQYPEFYVLTLFATLGMMLLGSSTHFVVLFIALEAMSLPIYVLVGFRRADRRSNEASLKYFILGSAASAVLLYGGALLYGATGTLYLPEMVEFITQKPEAMTPLFGLGVLFAVVGFLFKVASVPFHGWMPDVYEGAPTPVTGLMTTGLKAAAFASFLRLLDGAGYGTALSEVLQKQFHDVLWISAVITMVLGNVVALTQNNLKRMLAYSSIAHTGYLLVGIIAGPEGESGYGPVLMYLATYAVMNIGAFAVLTEIAGKYDRGLMIQDLTGLARRSPWLAFAMAVFMFSMAGVPPTAGFVGKYFLFNGAVQAGETPLVVIAVLCSAISVYYYLRVLVYMYMRDPIASTGVTGGGVPSTLIRVSLGGLVVVIVMALASIQLGVLPSRLVSASMKVVSSL